MALKTSKFDVADYLENEADIAEYATRTEPRRGARRRPTTATTPAARLDAAASTSW